MFRSAFVKQIAGQLGNAEFGVGLEQADPAQRGIGNDDWQAVIFQEQQRQAVRQHDPLCVLERESSGASGAIERTRRRAAKRRRLPGGRWACRRWRRRLVRLFLSAFRFGANALGRNRPNDHALLRIEIFLRRGLDLFGGNGLDTRQVSFQILEIVGRDAAGNAVAQTVHAFTRKHQRRQETALDAFQLRVADRLFA